MATSSTGASRAGYLVAVIVFIFGVLIAAALTGFFIYSILNLDDRLQRVVVPGTAELELEDTGRYTIFYEYRSTVDGREYRTAESIPDLDIRVTSVDTGEPVPVSSAFGSTTYETWNRAGESVATFRIDDPGTYELAAEYAGGVVGPEIVLALGEGIGTSILLSVGTLFGAGFVFCVTTVIALILIVVTLIRRSRTQPSLQQPPV
jgi:hypothetical protein